MWAALSLAVVSILPAADVTAGKSLFEGKGGCLRCHSINGHGGSLGPDLTAIAPLRTPKSLRLALTDPDAEIFHEYLTVVLTTATGQRVEGVELNEDDISIQVRDAEGNPRSFLRRNLKSVQREERSLMPSFSGKLTPAEIDDVVAYLRTLRGDSIRRPSARRTRQAGRLSENLPWMQRPERDSDERPETVLDALEIPAGATVADIGAGPGYFTWRLAARVGPRGRVIAVDVQKSMLDLLTAGAAQRGFKNVDVLAGSDTDPRLPAAALDLVLLANAYHEFVEPEKMLAAIRNGLKPQGRLVVLEYARENRKVDVSEPHKMSLDEIRAEMEAAGFVLDRILDFLPMQHGVIFSKRD